MLGLLHPTDSQWIDAVEGNLATLLQDHAQCELKAAHSALSLVGRYAGEMPSLAGPLLSLAREESEHVGLVHEQLKQRNLPLGHPNSDRYVTMLTAATKRNRHDGHPPLLDRLLMAALIEGRSCERFRLLSNALNDATLRVFYRDLMTTEARHFTLFNQLAAEAFGQQAARTRFATLAEREGEICRSLPLGPQVHG